jgi:Tol biopolymer transport system component
LARVTTLMIGTSMLAWTVGAVPAGASFPGGDGLIAFSYESPVPGVNLTQNDIFVIAAEGAGRTQLTRTPFRHEFAPAWSPDGSRIVVPGPVDDDAGGSRSRAVARPRRRLHAA